MTSPTDLPPDFPTFRYHPDPVGTGAVEASEEACIRCGEARGYVYAGSAFSGAAEPSDDVEVAEVADDPEPLCPWCIADGSAAAEYGCEFTDAAPLADAELSPAIIETVTKRTPGYISWQENEWRSCCDDACAYMGDASKDEVAALEGEELEELLEELEWEGEEWLAFVAQYEPGGHLSVHKFQCLHCKDAQYVYDPS
jgi:uncharacterized protein CbrC (UPF0167 family)